MEWMSNNLRNFRVRSPCHLDRQERPVTTVKKVVPVIPSLSHEIEATEELELNLGKILQTNEIQEKIKKRLQMQLILFRSNFVAFATTLSSF